MAAKKSGLAKESSLSDEVLKAFGTGRKIRVPGSNLAWLYQQCQTAGEERLGKIEKDEKFLHRLFSGDRSELSYMEKQTYSKWKSMMEFEKVKHPLRHRRRVIKIQPISWEKNHQDSEQDKDAHKEDQRLEISYTNTLISDAVLRLLVQFCSSFFSGMEVRLSPAIDLSDIPKLTSRIHPRTNRRQVLVDDIIDFLHVQRLKKCYCVLGVTMVDLYPGPEWNFVLGQASLLKGCGVFSFGRYFNSGLTSVRDGPGLMVDGPPVAPESGCCMKKEATMLQEEEQMSNIWVLMRVS